MRHAPLKVVVNADDLGLSAPIDQAIRDAFGTGLVTSASILAVGRTAEGAMAWAASTGRGFGVHLSLTEGAPLTRMKLAQPFSEALFPRLRDGAFEASELTAEWIAQVARVRAAGVVVDHLDTHQHLHYLPALFPVFVAVAHAVGVTRVRGMASTGGRLQPIRAWRFRRAIRAAGLTTTDAFSSVEAWSSSRRFETVELMCHPGNPAHERYADELTRLPTIVGERIPWSRVGA
jgi:predicted glycoside hydrolase/deacetylase ChbG (UPF0249 family)